MLELASSSRHIVWHHNNIIGYFRFVFFAHVIPFRLHNRGDGFNTDSRLDFIDPPNDALIVIGMVGALKMK